MTSVSLELSSMSINLAINECNKLGNSQAAKSPSASNVHHILADPANFNRIRQIELEYMSVDDLKK